MTTSISDTGALKARGAYRRSPDVTRSLVTCGGPLRKPCACHVQDPIGFFHSMTPFAASRAVIDHLPGTPMFADVASSTM